ncbi:MAG: hypothetical protein JST80_06760 [Bdellovibrionales bacterium]|nr:hypothetical protein [Bdellovibrionales bacterium]
MDNTLPNAQQHIQAAEQILIQMGAMEKHYQTMNSLDMSLGGSGYFNQAISNILTRANQYSKIGAEQSTQVHYHINTARALVQGYIDLHATIETICSKLIKLESLSDSSLLSKALTSKDLERCEINLGKSSSCAYIVTVNGIGFPDNKGCHANKSDAIKTLRDALQDRQCF